MVHPSRGPIQHQCDQSIDPLSNAAKWQYAFFCLFSRSFFSLAAPFKTPLFLPFAGVFRELKLNSRSKCQYARPNTSGPLPRRARGGVVEKRTLGAALVVPAACRYYYE